MGNIGSQSGHLKYKPTNQENLHWPHSFPRAQTRCQQKQNPMKVLPEKTPKVRLRPTENGEILQTGGTLTGRQIQANTRQIKKSGSEPHLHSMVNLHYSEPFHHEKERKFKKKYKAPPPPHQDLHKNGSYDYWDTKKDTSPKPRLFKTKIECERKRSVPEYVDKSEYFQSSHQSLQESIVEEKPKQSYPSSHRLSLPALNTPVWDFQGELREATKKLRKIGSDDSNLIYSTTDRKSETPKRNKLNTLDHHMDRTDLIKLKEINLENAKTREKSNVPVKQLRSEASGKESSLEETSPLNLPLEAKIKQPKQFYFGMTLSHKSNSSKNNNLDKMKKNYADSESSFEIKRNGYYSDEDLHPSQSLMPKKSQELSRFSPIMKWKQSSSAESVINPEPSKESKYSSEEAEDPPRIFSIFPTRSRSNDRSRSGDSGISGDGSPAVYEDASDPLIHLKNDTKSSHSLLPGWTPQQDLGDDSSFEEESYSAGDYAEAFEPSSPQRHVFSLSLPRDHSYTSYANSDYNINETNLDKFKRSVSGMFNINRKEAESSPENERGNWFLNKSCNSLNSTSIQLNYSLNTEELEETATRNVKLNSRRLMYLPKMDKPLRPRRYETRNRPISVNEKIDRSYYSSENLTEMNSTPVPESLQDSPVMNDRRSPKKKPKRFTFQSTIRQIERRRIAEKLSREAEKKEQQRLRELEVMQKVEREFQKKRAREKVNIKQQLSRYTDNTLSNSTQDLKIDMTPVRDVLQTRSEPDGAASSSPTSSLTQLDSNKQDQKKFSQMNKTDVNSRVDYKSCSDSDDNRSKSIMQTKVLSEYRQTQREYRDYPSSKKHTADGEASKQTTVHPEVTYKMPKSKGVSRHGSNNYRKNFAYGIKTKSEQSKWNQQPAQSKSKYYSQFGPLTRF